VCDGADGADGSHFVTSVDNAAWGGVCTFGGVRIATGADANSNGVLDAAEVGDVQYVCNVVPSVIAAGDGATCVVMSDSSVRCAGSNNHGQLGLGTVDKFETVFQAVPGYGDETGLAPVTNAASGFAHVCFLLASGTVQCAGDNTHGQLGNGTFNESHTPVAVSGLANVTQISGSFNSTCALSGGHVYCWGQNDHGQLGNGSTLDRSTPVQVSGLSNAFAISVGSHHACALTGIGQAYCWGANGSGQLGDNTTTEHHTPFGVSGLSTGIKISVGGDHTCAIVKGGTVYCWGANNFGQLGDGTITDHHFPHALGAYPPNAVDIGLAEIDSCARYANGSIYCWGGTVLADHSMTPLQVAGWNWTSLSTGLGYGCGLRGNREAWCWGDNGSGQFGTLNLTASFSPVQIDVDAAP
jgi:alpha-tubulin suppressor-like RCC1 family protein